MELEERLKKSNYYMYAVIKRNCYIKGPDGGFVNFGMYYVNVMNCCNQEDLDKIIKNFTYIYESDNNSFITDNEFTAFMAVTILNNKLTENMIKSDFAVDWNEGIKNDGRFSITEFEDECLKKCIDIIENNKRRW